MFAYTKDFINSKKKHGKIDANFTTQCGIIERELFESVGGFDINMKEVLIEDDEFGYRLLKSASIYLSENLIVQHYFDDFRYSIKKIFKQTVSWINIFFLKRKQFDSIGKTFSEAINKLSSFGILLSVFFIFLIPVIGLILISVTGLIFLFTSKRLLIMAYRQHGILFFMYAMFVHFFVGVIVSVGALFGLFYFLYQFMFERNLITNL
jgi:GT2 family glycosyltransferase